MWEKWIFLQVQIGIMVLIILALRQCMKKLPKVYSYVLWLLVFVRLLCPVTIESRISLIPSGETGILQDVVENWLDNGEVTNDAAGTDGNVALNGMEGAVAGNVNGIPGTDNIVNVDGMQNSANTLNAGNMPGAENTSDANLPSGNAGMLQNTVGTIQGNAKIDEGTLGLTTEHAALPDGAETGKSVSELILAVIICIGTAGILSYNFYALLRIKKKLRDVVWQEENVFVCDKMETPFVTGFLKPRIYLPATLQGAEREYVLCHERTHIRRKDYLVKNVAFLLTAVYWYNPFVWVAFILMECDMEMSCDEAVVGKLGSEIKKQYSQSLLSFAVGKTGMPVTPLPFGENSVKQRVKNVLSYKKARVWACVAGIIVIVIAGVTLLTTRMPGDGEQNLPLVTASPEPPGNGEEADVQATIEPQASSVPDSSAPATFVPAPVVDMDDGLYVRTEIDRKDVEQVLYGWAEAFSGRDGDRLYELSQDKENFEKWDLVYPLEEGGYAFGASSPWPWMHHYEIFYEEGGTEAVIRYEMNSSEPAITIGREVVEVVKEGEEYAINHKEFKQFDNIRNAGEFALAYDDGYPNMQQYAAVINRHLQDGINDAYYNQYKDPVSAAKLILHLGEGTGEVTYRESATQEEETAAMVTYTFAEDGSQVEIPMQTAEPVWPIWMVDNGIGQMFRVYEAVGEQPAYLVTNLGIYAQTDEGTECLYPYFVGVQPMLCIQDDRLFFMTDLNYEEGNLDWINNGICYINRYTGESGILQLAGYDNDKSIDYFYIGDGYVNVMFTGEDLVSMYLLPDTGRVVYNDKTAEELFPEQAEEYGQELSKDVLERKTCLFRIAHHTAEETYAYIDLDLDGTTDKIVLKPDPKEGYIGYTPLDYYTLTVNDVAVEFEFMECLINDMWAISLDGESILFVLYEAGPSDDPYTHFYRYEDGKLVKVGGISDDIRSCEIGADGLNGDNDSTISPNGIISGTTRCDIVQSNYIYVKWHQNAEGVIEQISEETYEFVNQNEVELKVDLPLYSSPGGEEGFGIGPQKVSITTVTSDHKWVKIVAENGDEGWCRIESWGTIVDLDMISPDVFEGLQFFD